MSQFIETLGNLAVFNCLEKRLVRGTTRRSKPLNK
jgi:hypothetical protein